MARSRAREHIRSNVIGYVAVFIALSGTAYASHPGGNNTIDTGDIINGQVATNDLNDGAVKAAKVAGGAILSNKVLDDTSPAGGLNAPDLNAGSVGSSEIADLGIGAADLATDAIPQDGGFFGGSTKIADSAVGAAEIADSNVGGSEILDQAVTGADIGTDAVGGGEIADGAVGAFEIGDDLVDRLGSPVTVAGGAAENGSYNIGTAAAFCSGNEELIGGSARWSPDNASANNFELFIGKVRLNHASESVVVDGGNDSGTDHSLIAVATCLPQ